MKMNEETGGSFSSAITSKKSYGATNSRMLTVINSKMITHQLQPTDTLQGLAVKYGVTVEQLKRVNKLWSNESILTKDYLSIPTENSTEDSGDVDTTQNKKVEDHPRNVEYIKPELLKESDESRMEIVKLNSKREYSAETDSHSKRVDRSPDVLKKENLEQFKKIMHRVDETINNHKEDVNLENCSDAYKAFNDILSKIDNQIQTHKEKNKDVGVAPDLPVVGYDGSYQNARLFSPTRQHPYLEQGI